ncbi:histidine phosphatase family protein [Paenibacillus sp. sptzw28]|uniref:histidine phosphatase family protein n=1 Tax=Paenibacillus sp. sptzw28 TaxID=715179 RepID=UPI001C6EC90C|nr:histidine phosphatase family protein [Paenibacillus sp. sptzw28]QYR21290.1 histidine phosphatase family protein [Paenibacillus sp. sptzw28]
MTTHIYMIRHAESPFVHGEESTRGLSEAGHEAVLTINEIMRPEQVDVVVSSSYERAVLTVQGVADERGLTVTRFEELRERAIEGLDYRTAWEELEGAIKQSFIDKDYALPGGESTRHVQERAIPVIRRLLQEYAGRKIAIGTHGNIMTIIMNYFDESYGYDFWNSTSKPDIYRLDFDGERLIAVKRLWEA